MKSKESNGISINVKSFLTAIIVIFLLMIASYILTLVIPGGSFARIPDDQGNPVIDTSSPFVYQDGGIPFWKWLLSPILVLGATGNGTLISVIAFLLVIGGIFNCLEKCGLMRYMLDKVAFRFCNVRYQLMAVITIFFMAMGAMIGSFEECVPLVPIVVALAVKLGWDPLTGMGMSLLTAGCGFASGVCNPFTVGVAQQLAGLPMFSGISLRLVSFVLIYAHLLAFLWKYGKKIEQNPREIKETTFIANNHLDNGLRCFATIMSLGIGLILMSGLITALQDYTMIIVAVMFLLAGITSALFSGMDIQNLGKSFCSGVSSIFPAVVMILMASSIRYTLEEAHVLDTILHWAVKMAENLPDWTVILFIYVIVLIMNFFIPSGSAKAFMLIPLIVPMAQVFDLSAQLCIVAFAFGDGFSNVFYPTNPALLIALGLADISYGDWFRWSIKFQLRNLLLTCLILLFGLVIGY